MNVDDRRINSFSASILIEEILFDDFAN